MAKIDAFPLERAADAANEILELLAPACRVAEVAGSIRRKSVWVHDVDIVCQPIYEVIQVHDLFGHLASSTYEPALLAEALQGLAEVKQGARIVKFVYREIPVELYLTEPSGDNYGALLQLRTGSAEFNIGLASRAKKMGLQYKAGFGVWRNGTRVDNHHRGERGIFEALGMAFLEPERRRG